MVFSRTVNVLLCSILCFPVSVVFFLRYLSSIFSYTHPPTLSFSLSSLNTLTHTYWLFFQPVWEALWWWEEDNGSWQPTAAASTDPVHGRAVPGVHGPSGSISWAPPHPGAPGWAAKGSGVIRTASVFLQRPAEWPRVQATWARAGATPAGGGSGQELGCSSLQSHVL